MTKQIEPTTAAATTTPKVTWSRKSNKPDALARVNKPDSFQNKLKSKAYSGKYSKQAPKPVLKIKGKPFAGVKSKKPKSKAMLAKNALKNRH